jgi:hypothetical protein
MEIPSKKKVVGTGHIFCEVTGQNKSDFPSSVDI